MNKARRFPSIHSEADILATVQNLANFLWQFDRLSRLGIAPLMEGLALNPDAAAEVAQLMAAMASVQAPLTRDTDLNAWMRGRKQ
jgi:hypothetical protein